MVASTPLQTVTELSATYLKATLQTSPDQFCYTRTTATYVYTMTGFIVSQSSENMIANFWHSFVHD